MKKILGLVTVALLLFGCKNGTTLSDAYGNFEADDIMISAETSGKITAFSYNEGDEITTNTTLAVIDSTDHFLKKLELIETAKGITIKKSKATSELKTLAIIKEKAKQDRDSYLDLLNEKVVPQEIYDNKNNSYKLAKERYKTGKQAIALIEQELNITQVKLQQVDNILKKCRITSPINSVILNKYYNIGEMVTAGKPLLKVANLDNIYLKAYIDGNQLSQVKLNQQVEILIDSTDGELKSYVGTITYIASKSEFTPKIIQTKDERTKLVYAIKVSLTNDGFVKIGMPAEVRFGN